jgi:hypothetical protein
MTTPTPPRRATGRPRSTPKRARKPGQPYDEATKAKAVAQLEAEGMSATHKATGIPKGTLTRWAKAAGVDLGEQARARTAAASATVRARAVEVKAGTVELLEQHIGQAGDYLSTVAGVNALAAKLIAGMDPANLGRVVTLAGTAITINDTTVDEVLKVAEALGALPLAVRDAEGILTRAIHDLQLLKGEATERGELVVEFAVPRPTPLDPASVPTYDTQEN